MFRKIILLVIALAAALAGLATPGVAQVTPPGGLVTSTHDGLCLEIKNGSYALSAPAGAGVCNHTAYNQRWEFINLRNGYHQIRVAHTGMCLNVGYASQHNGEVVVQYRCGQNDEWLNDQWRLAYLDSGSLIIVARHSGKCLDKSGYSIVQWQCTGVNWQRWGAGAGLEVSTAASTGNVQTRSAQDGLCLGTQFESLAASARIIVGPCNSTATNQRWTFAGLTTGFHQIRNAHSQMCLNVGYASHRDGEPVVQYSCGVNNQWMNDQWRLVPVGNGSHLVIAAHSGKCLDRSGYSVVQWTCHGGAGQRWVTSVSPALA